MKIEDNNYAKMCKKLSDYADKNGWSRKQYHEWLQNNTDLKTFIIKVKKLIGEL